MWQEPTYCSGRVVLRDWGNAFDDGSGDLKQYGPGSSCEWLIAPQPEAGGITIKFSQFELANNDLVNVYECKQEACDKKYQVQTLTGYRGSQTVEVQSGYALISFVSNYGSRGNGFVASWKGKTKVRSAVSVIVVMLQ